MELIHTLITKLNRKGNILTTETNKNSEKKIVSLSEN